MLTVKRQIFRGINYQYIGINLKKGTHDIKLHYQLPGIKLAFMITGCGIIAFVAIIIFNIVQEKDERIRGFFNTL